MAELSDETYDKITELSEAGDQSAHEELYEKAIGFYQTALDLLPAPRDDLETWTWLYAAIGDAEFLREDYTAAFEAFSKAVRGPDGLGNPFIHLRLGQCAFELKDETRAADELMRAYMGGGEEVFEDADKYLDFLKTKADL